MNDYSLYCAFALGYYHGRVDGVELNPYDHTQDERDYYKRGYDKGIADYCAAELDGEYDEWW